VVIDPGEHIRERSTGLDARAGSTVAGGPRTLARCGPGAPVGHAPEVREHGPDAGGLRPELKGSEMVVEEKIQGDLDA
jgi:hypothetical protein